MRFRHTTKKCQFLFIKLRFSSDLLRSASWIELECLKMHFAHAHNYSYLIFLFIRVSIRDLLFVFAVVFFFERFPVFGWSVYKKKCSSPRSFAQLSWNFDCFRRLNVLDVTTFQRLNRSLMLRQVNLFNPVKVIASNHDTIRANDSYLSIVCRIDDEQKMCSK